MQPPNLTPSAPALTGNSTTASRVDYRLLASSSAAEQPKDQEEQKKTAPALFREALQASQRRMQELELEHDAAIKNPEGGTSREEIDSRFASAMFLAGHCAINKAVDVGKTGGSSVKYQGTCLITLVAKDTQRRVKEAIEESEFQELRDKEEKDADSNDTVARQRAFLELLFWVTLCQEWVAGLLYLFGQNIVSTLARELMLWVAMAATVVCTATGKANRGEGDFRAAMIPLASAGAMFLSNIAFQQPGLEMAWIFALLVLVFSSSLPLVLLRDECKARNPCSHQGIRFYAVPPFLAAAPV